MRSWRPSPPRGTIVAVAVPSPTRPSPQGGRDETRWRDYHSNDLTPGPREQVPVEQLRPPPPRTRPSQRDIGLFTTLLGEVLREHQPQTGPGGGRAGCATASCSCAEGRPGAPREAGETHRGATTTQTLSEVIRAFTIYFGLVSTAEELNAYLNRINRVRLPGERLWVGSFDDTARLFHAEGVNGRLPESARAPGLSAGVHRPPHRVQNNAPSGSTFRRIFLVAEDLHRRRLNEEELETASPPSSPDPDPLEDRRGASAQAPGDRRGSVRGCISARIRFDAVPDLYRQLERAVRRPTGRTAASGCRACIRFGS